MHLAFIDITYGYAADRPDGVESLGGTTSAVCFMARELAKAGITCTLFNRIAEEKTMHGVQAMPLDALAQECLKPDYSAFIFCGRWMPGIVQFIKQHTKAPLIAWMHESSFNKQLVTALPEFDAVTYVSEWQKRINQSHAQPHRKQVVIKNGMNPTTMGLFSDGESILANKTKPPILLFSGTVPRGVMHLPPILDELRKKRNDFSMEIYCNTNPSGHAEQDGKYIDWLRSLPNITHVGMVGQMELVQKMKRATLFVAPNPWPETSCIALMEAMAAGLSVITTNRAALPETAAGFARHIVIDDVDDPARFDMPVPHLEFAEAIDAKLDEYASQSGVVEENLQKQVAYCASHYQWHQRVSAWVDLVTQLR
jgi:glycosyltransferase involved in cell wall biosynthesis